MRVTPAVLPSLWHRLSFRAPVVAGMVCVALAASGCASRGILGEKPAVTQKEGTELVPEQGAQTTTVTKLQKFMWFFSPYRPDIQQGNFISEEMLAQLKVGMTRDQVRFILGTSLLTDIFHADRWDYPFRLARGNGETTSSRVIVFFDKEGKVARFEGATCRPRKNTSTASPARRRSPRSSPRLTCLPLSCRRPWRRAQCRSRPMPRPPFL